MACGIYLNQGLNPGLLHCQADSPPLESPWKPHTLFKIYLFLIEGHLLYNIAWVYVIQQHESVIGIHMSPPLELPPTLSHTLFYMTLFLDSHRAIENYESKRFSDNPF